MFVYNNYMYVSADQSTALASSIPPQLHTPTTPSLQAFKLP